MRSSLMVPVVNKSVSAEACCSNWPMRSTCAPQLRGELLFGLLLVEELATHAVDLRAQFSNLVFIGDSHLSRTTDQAGEVIAKREIGTGRNRQHCRDYERGSDGWHA